MAASESGGHGVEGSGWRSWPEVGKVHAGHMAVGPVGCVCSLQRRVRRGQKTEVGLGQSWVEQSPSGAEKRDFGPTVCAMEKDHHEILWGRVSPVGTEDMGVDKNMAGLLPGGLKTGGEGRGLPGSMGQAMVREEELGHR